mmetsp:Transcript_21396/g.44002  ORF Transcript_21396/g.44002 Transcript_21396/m.44002 type:complete len:100 (+) Transcript_21396:1126-1425(+)
MQGMHATPLRPSVAMYVKYQRNRNCSHILSSERRKLDVSAPLNSGLRFSARFSGVQKPRPTPAPVGGDRLQQVGRRIELILPYFFKAIESISIVRQFVG